MEDKDFFAEIVKRISPPLKRKTDIELTRIVLYNTAIAVDSMFNDKGVDEVFKDSIQGEAYRFIRDNQNLYVNPEYINYEQIHKIIHNEKAVQLLNTNSFSDREYQMLLNHAIYLRAFDLVKLLMEKGIKPSLDTSFFIESLANDNKQLDNLKYLDSQKIDLLKLGSGKLLFNAAINENIEGLNYLIQKTPVDFPIIIKSFKRYIYHEYEAKEKYKPFRDDFDNILDKMIPVVHLLMKKISQIKFEEILKSVKAEELKEFLTKQYFTIKLNNELSESERIKQKLKI